MTEQSSLEAAKTIASVLKGNGFKAFLAGGCVRDRILGKEPKDFDLCTSAKPEEVILLFSHTIPVGAAFGVVKVLLGESIATEVATFRSDGKYSDQRRPDEIELISDPIEDVKRRDFRMNGLLMDPTTDEIFDYVGGKQDIENRVIRCIGNPIDRFTEDPLRMLRAIRFISQLGFRLDSEVLNAIKIAAPTITIVSKERIREELTKLLIGDYVGDALFYLHRSQLSRHIETTTHPTIFNILNQVNTFDRIGKVKDHRIAWAMMLNDVGDVWRWSSALESLRFSKSDIDFITKSIALMGKLEHFSGLGLSQKRKACHDQYIESALELHRLKYLDQVTPSRSTDSLLQAVRSIQQLGYPIPLLNGNDLLELGFLRGPEYKGILDSAFEYQLNNSSATKEGVIHYICNVKYKHIIRLLNNGFFSDGYKKVRMAGKCGNKSCGLTMMFTSGWLWNKTDNKYEGSACNKIKVLDTLNCMEESYEFVCCTGCGRKKKKEGFTRLRDE